MRAIPSRQQAPLRVRDIMTDNVLTASRHDDVRLASQMMLWGAFHHLPVVEEGRLIGVVTKRELNRVRATFDPASSRVAVGEVMVSDVVTTEPNAFVSDAADRMVDAYVGCLPVLDDGKLVGIVTSTDVLACSARPRLAEPRIERTVASVMTAKPHVVTRSTTLMRAIELMVEHGIRHIPVVDDQQKLIGMLSDRDVRTSVGDPLTALCDADFGPAASSTVDDAMSTEPVISVRAEESMAVLAWAFVDQRVGAVPVVDDAGQVVGIVSYVDLLHRGGSPK